jgi:multisubunit Na+/H+ antiporter MnhC subunit
MTLQTRLWITAVVVGIAAAALMLGLTVTAHAGVNHAKVALAGITFNGID